MIDPILDPKRQALVAAINRRRGSVDEVVDAALSGELDQIAVTDQVRLDVGRWIFHAVADAGLGPEMDNPVEPCIVQRRIERGEVCEVDPLEEEGVAKMLAETGEAGFLEGRNVIIVDDVDADDGVAALQQGARSCRADEPSCTCHENAHALRLAGGNDRSQC